MMQLIVDLVFSAVGYICMGAAGMYAYNYLVYRRKVVRINKKLKARHTPPDPSENELKMPPEKFWSKYL